MYSSRGNFFPVIFTKSYVPIGYIVSIPLILAFVGYEDVVMRGFVALEAMPDFYKTAVGVVFAASFGVKAMTKMFKK